MTAWEANVCRAVWNVAAGEIFALADASCSGRIW
jgi:hypothetical protein